MGSQNVASEFIHCEDPECRKKLAKRLPGGEIEFIFGRAEDGHSPVEMKITGEIEMLCLRKKCGRINHIASD